MLKILFCILLTGCAENYDTHRFEQYCATQANNYIWNPEHKSWEAKR